MIKNEAKWYMKKRIIVIRSAQYALTSNLRQCREAVGCGMVLRRTLIPPAPATYLTQSAEYQLSHEYSDKLLMKNIENLMVSNPLVIFPINAKLPHLLYNYHRHCRKLYWQQNDISNYQTSVFSYWPFFVEEAYLIFNIRFKKLLGGQKWRFGVVGLLEDIRTSEDVLWWLEEIYTLARHCSEISE